MQLKDPHSFSSDHLAVHGRLLSSLLRSNHHHLLSRKQFPLKVPKQGLLMKANALFQELKEAATHPTWETRARALWVSNSTWHLVNERMALRCS
jgi:hypothetical protein